MDEYVKIKKDELKLLLSLALVRVNEGVYGFISFKDQAEFDKKKRDE